MCQRASSWPLELLEGPTDPGTAAEVGVVEEGAVVLEGLGDFTLTLLLG